MLSRKTLPALSEAGVRSDIGRPFRDAIAAALILLMIAEWMRPLIAMSELTGLHMLGPFLAAFGAFLAIDWLRIPPSAGWPLKAVVSLFWVGYVFARTSPSPFDWAAAYAGTLAEDAEHLLAGRLAEISPESRTLIFLGGWAFLLSYLYASAVERQRVAGFVAATAIYLLALQLWPGVNTNVGLIRVVWYGFLLLTVVHWTAVERMFGVGGRRESWPAGWLAAAAFVLVVAIAAGLWTAREEPGTVRPLEWNAFAERFHGWSPASSARATPAAGEASLSGYGRDDRVLGGPIRPDDRVAFVAKTERLTYWRGEAKIVYTGRGWEDSPATPAAASFGGDRDEAPSTAEDDRQLARGSTAAAARLSAAEAADSPSDGETAGSGDIGETDRMPDDMPREGYAGGLDAGADSRLIVQEIAIRDPALDKQLFAGGTIERIEEIVARDGSRIAPESVTIDAETGRATLADGSGSPAYYRVTVALPPDGDEVMAADPAPVGGVPEQLRPYLQLPDSFPSRVAALARAVTERAGNDFEKAKAIETYLRTNFVYDTERPVVPGAGQDFVDHFLFEQKFGYCDHFSTAMTVMLRAVGIPARWVKGFAPGEVRSSPAEIDGITETNSAGNMFAPNGAATGSALPNAAETDAIHGAPGDPASRDRTVWNVVVRNRDAHSWVEAYISGAGWVPFEPTPGFSGPGSPSPQIGPAASTSAADAETKRSGAFDRAATVLSAWLGGTLPVWIDRLSAWQDRVAPAAVLAAAAASFVPLALLVRRRFRRRPVARSFITAPSGPAVRALNRLWRRVFARFGGKRPAETVREYAQSLPVEGGGREALAELVRLYESVRYGGTGAQTFPKRQLNRLWQRIRAGGRKTE
jgi:transglutaminase-like putative cysteine protease